MNYIRTTEFSKNRAYRDIFYCLNNANTRADYTVGQDNDKFFVDNPHFYLNPSDNVKEAIRGNVKQGDTVLTVAGSGDYMFESILNGASRVDNYDINAIQYYIVCLKIWAMKQLNYEEYVNFLTKITKEYLDFKVINKVIKEYKEEAAYPFWDYFMKARRIEKHAIDELKMNPFVGAPILISKISTKSSSALMDYVIATEIGPALMSDKFKAMRLVQCYTVENNSLGYLENEENYNFVKSRLDDVVISFFVSNVTEIKKHVKDKYDVVFLSNIPFYLTSSTIVDLIDNNLMDILNDNGRICAYHQGMRMSWFKNVVYDSKFKISRKEFNMNSESIQLNISGVQNILLAHKELCRKRLKFIMREIPTYGGAPEMRVNTDVLSYVKRR